jgi:hypothetical protein
VPSGINTSVEQGKLRSMEDSIRNFVLAADPSSANVVPLKEGNLALTTPELDAFRALYGDEKSFRADYAAALRRIISIQARLTAELQGFSAKQKSAYLWKPHADALTYLFTCVQRLEEQCRAILKMGEQRGLTDKISAMNASLQKLRVQVQAAAKALKGASDS